MVSTNFLNPMNPLENAKPLALERDRGRKGHGEKVDGLVGGKPGRDMEWRRSLIDSGGMLIYSGTRGLLFRVGKLNTDTF